MARIKSQKPLAEAPPDPESSGAESSSSTEAEDEPTPQTQENDEEEEEEGDEASSSTAASSDDDPPLKKQPESKKPASDDSSSDDDDDSPVKNLKTITSPTKPTTATTTTTPATKPRSGPKPAGPALTAEKRPLESDDVKGVTTTSSKKPRKEKEKKEKEKVVSEEGSKKQAVPFQRLFSDDDEIAILKGMIEYRTKKGADPMIEADDFYGFIKNNLQVDVNRGQFVDKVRRLKKRYINAVQKKKKVTSPHEVMTFDLSKKIWDYGGNDGGVGNAVTVALAAGDEKGSNGVVENSNAGGKSSSKRVVKSKSVGSVGVVEEKKGKDEDGGLKGWRISECDEKHGEFEVGEAVSNEVVRKKGLRLMGAKARAEISEMWEKVVVAQREVDSMRFDVQKEENRRILEAIKSGKSQAK